MNNTCWDCGKELKASDRKHEVYNMLTGKTHFLCDKRFEIEREVRIKANLAKEKK